MSDQFPRITTRPDQLGGAPCIRGFRMPVETIVAMVAAGMSDDEILTDFPDLEREDIREALRFWKNQPTVPQDALPIAK